MAWIADRGRGEARVEPQARLGVRAESRRAAEGADLDDAAERVAVGRGGVDGREHALLGGGIRAADLARARAGEGLGVAGIGRRLDVPDAQHAPEHRDPELPEQPLRDRADGDARGRLAGRGALEHVAHVVEPVLHDAREVGVTRSRQHDLAAAARCDLGELLVAHRPRAHRRAPVGVVAVAHDQGERPAEREPVAHAAEDLDVVLLDLLPRAAAVAACRRAEVERGSPRGRARGPRAGRRPRP